MNFPLLVCIVSFAILTIAARLGDLIGKKAKGAPKAGERGDLTIQLSALLTLLFLIIGFSFSMAVSRYDLRKNSEQGEAIAIGTLYTRADLLVPEDAAKVRPLLKKYLDQRISFYVTRDSSREPEIVSETIRLQTSLWSLIRQAITAVPPPLMGLLVSGVNDVVNSQRNSQAAFLNRIPLAAGALLITIGIGCCGLIGFYARRTDWTTLLMVPVVASISFFLIADLDSPRGGAIRVAPLNLSDLLRSLPGQ